MARDFAELKKKLQKGEEFVVKQTGQLASSGPPGRPDERSGKPRQQATRLKPSRWY